MPITLWEAAVSDRGSVGGYAYSVTGTGRERVNRFHIVILDAKGDVLRLDSTDREFPGPDSGLFPQAYGLVAHPELDLLHICVATGDTRIDPPWSGFHLATGEPAPALVPDRPLDAGPQERLRCRSIHALSGTALYVVEWNFRTRHPDTGEPEIGAVYSLIDREGNTSWMVKRPGEFMDPHGKGISNHFERRIRQQGMLLDLGRPGRFAVWFAKDEVAVEYEVAPSSPGGWSVTEVKRTPRRLADLEPQATKIDLPLVMCVKFDPVVKNGEDEGTVSSPLDLQSPRTASIDHLGRIAIRDRENGGVFVFDHQGECRFVCPPKEGDSRDRWGSYDRFPVDDSGHVYIPWDEEGTTHFRLDDRGHRSSVFDLGSTSAHFVPGSFRRWICGGGDLRLIDSDGEELVTVRRRSDGKWIGVSNYDVAPDGMVVVLDRQRNLREDEHAIAFIDADGTPVDTVLIPPRSRRGIAANLNWVVFGYGRSPFLLRRHDRALFAFEPPIEDSKGEHWEYGFSPDGKELWGVAVKDLTLYRYALPD